jgi:hypothetical protein
MFNASGAEVIMVLRDAEGAKEARLPAGQGKRLAHHSLAGGGLSVRAGRCEYAYDLEPIEREPHWGEFYVTRLERDFTLRALVPSEKNSGRPRGDLPAFETEARIVRPDRICH